MCRHDAPLAYVISIHAPRAGSDDLVRSAPRVRVDFNPRSPCGERRLQHRRKGHAQRFQATLPVRGATVSVCQHFFTIFQFPSTLPVRGATKTLYRRSLEILISIHAPRAGSDRKLRFAYVVAARISIHAPCAGSDPSVATGWSRIS